MRKSTEEIEQYRLKKGLMSSDKSYGFNGVFFIPYQDVTLKVICADRTTWKGSGMPGKPWEHVSVSLPDRCPTWLEMEYVRELFWRDDETVMQLSVPRSNHINIHATCLHMWRPVNHNIPVPPKQTV